MIERTFRTFKSWDEVSPGDILMWFVNDEYKGYTVEYVKPHDNGGPYFHAIPIEAKMGETLEDDNDDWCADIYPYTFGHTSVGWVIEDKIKTFAYDPTQQPEDDSI